MSTALLKKAYNSQDFRSIGHELVDLLADHLENSLNEKAASVIKYTNPEEELKYWQSREKEGFSDPLSLFKTVLQRSIHIHHPHYMGHQVAPSLPLNALASLMGALLNNGMAVYEMGVAATAIEKRVISFLNRALGYGNGAGGFLTSGGSLANLTALLAARQLAQKKYPENTKWAIMVSEQAHYCIKRSAHIMDISPEGIIGVPTDKNYRLRTPLLESYLKKATKNGFKVFAIVGSAPSTATGAHDNLEEIAAFALKNKIWFHVDAAHGGGAIFSEKYKHLLRGIAQADSVTIDGHKMMMSPTLTTALLFKEDKNSFASFAQKADYLWSEEGNEWYNGAKRTFECTKLMMSLRLYSTIITFGSQLFSDFVTKLYSNSRAFANILKNTPDFKLALLPESNIICFRYVQDFKEEQLNALNGWIREQILKKGHFYIVQTQLDQKIWLRTTIMNPFTDDKHFTDLLNSIRNTVKTYNNEN